VRTENTCNPLATAHRVVRLLSQQIYFQFQLAIRRMVNRQQSWSTTLDRRCIPKDVSRIETSLAPYREAVASSSSAQAQTAFLSFSVSLASGCMVAYCQGGILPVDTSPQMDSNLSCLRHCE
jgi:hypothetical protein